MILPKYWITMPYIKLKSSKPKRQYYQKTTSSNIIIVAIKKVLFFSYMIYRIGSTSYF